MTSIIGPRTVPTPLVQGSASILIVPANPTRLGLYLYNPGTSTLWFSLADTVAAVNGAGSVALAPLQGVVLDVPYFTSGFNCIGTLGTVNNPVTAWEFT